MRLLRTSGGLLALALLCGSAMAAGTGGATDAVRDAFFARHFTSAPTEQAVWLTPETKARARQVAGFAPDGARATYWRQGTRTAWILDRVGKEAPITFGVVVENGTIVALDVLVYRESRGHEIRSPRWLAQFAGARAADGGLDRRIDNITGATLSVRAGRDVARLALALHAAATASADAPPDTRHTTSATHR